MVRKYQNNQEKLDAIRQAIAVRQKWLKAVREGHFRYQPKDEQVREERPHREAVHR